MRQKTFDEQVRRTATCWIWEGRHDKDRYGTYRLHGKYNRATRYVWEREYGPIPPGMFVLHTCDNPPCVRPEHLFLGTPLDNMQDKIAKGRARYYRKPGRVWSKLTEKTASAIRERYSQGGISQAEIGRQHGVSQQLVSRVIAGEIW